jgi:hypothetical protein
MSRKYVFIPVLVTLVVLVVALFPAANVPQRASAAPRAAVVTKYLMIPAAAFNVTLDGQDYYNEGSFMGFSSGSGDFVAPVYLPPGARIRLIKLYAYDMNTTHNLCARLFHTYPKTGGASQIELLCTTGSSGKQQPTKYVSHYVNWYYGYLIRLNYPANAGLSTYAVLIKYNVRQ